MARIGFDAARLVRNRVFGTRVTQFWFDKEYVLRHVDQAKAKILSRFGYFVMRDARQSIRKRKRPAAPGQPPTNQTGLLKKFIYFSYERERRSVVIGPALLPSARQQPPIPQVLEEGGLARGVFRRPVRIQARPYMQPAFDRQLAKNMPQMWRNGL